MGKSYKDRERFLRKEKLRNETNIHHIINRCKKSLFSNLEDDENKTRMRVIDHNNLHDFFGNDLPREMLERVRDVIATVLNPQDLRDLDEIISRREDMLKNKFKRPGRKRKNR